MKIEPKIFKAYDIRGIYPGELNEELIYAVGQAYAQFLNPKTIAVGHDVRSSGPKLYDSLIKGLTDAGVNVVKIGPISTEMLYFSVGQYGYDGGISVTASHNPPEYNGLKMVKAGAEPLSGETGIYEIRDMVTQLLDKPIKAATSGSVSEKDIFDDYKEFVLSFIDPSSLKPLRVVANANFGYQGVFAEKVLEGLPIELSLINGEPDGTFPKGKPDPFIPENRPEFIQKIKDEKPDLGVAWDADADRCFFATGDGEFLEAYYLNALLSKLMLDKNPGAKIIYDIRYTWAIIDTVKAAGGHPIKSRVGHAFIKQAMRKQDAVFSGESSGHYYFKDFFFADSGMVPFLLVMELISKTNKTLRELVQPLLDKYFVSGEINSEVADVDQVIKELKEKYADGQIDETDGLAVEYGRDWRFGVRASNTEPLLRLNVEASSSELMEQKKEEILGIIRG